MPEQLHIFYFSPAGLFDKLKANGKEERGNFGTGRFILAGSAGPGLNEKLNCKRTPFKVRILLFLYKRLGKIGRKHTKVRR